jgi:hypothetical protein
VTKSYKSGETGVYSVRVMMRADSAVDAERCLAAALPFAVLEVGSAFQVRWLRDWEEPATVAPPAGDLAGDALRAARELLERAAANV